MVGGGGGGEIGGGGGGRALGKCERVRVIHCRPLSPNGSETRC